MGWTIVPAVMSEGCAGHCELRRDRPPPAARRLAAVPDINYWRAVAVVLCLQRLCRRVGQPAIAASFMVTCFIWRAAERGAADGARWPALK